MRDQYEVVDQESLDLFMESVEVFNDSGNPFFTVCDAGVCVAFDDPFEIGVWHDDFQTFLSFLVWLSAAATGHTPLSEIESVFEDEFEIFEGESFLENAIEEAKTHADPRH